MSKLGALKPERRSEDGTRRLLTIGESSTPFTLLCSRVVIRVPLTTADETHLIRPTASDILIFSPPLAPRPSTRLRLDGTIKGLFLSTPTALQAGTTSAKPVPAASEPAVAVWMGEKKGAPASLALYTLSSLVGKAADETAVNGEDKTETRDIPMTTARKAFYKADKLSVKWNPAGTMVCLRVMSYKVEILILTGSIPHAHRRRCDWQIILWRDKPVSCQCRRVF